MFYTQERDQLRQFYVDTWQKARQNRPLDAMEAQVAKVIDMHPEYHALLEQGHHQGNNYAPEQGETNPFLHMGMHLAIQEQVAMDRPTGIQNIYQTLIQVNQDAHQTEHQMMECLGEALWQAQRAQGQQPPDEQAYLKCLQTLSTPR